MKFGKVLILKITHLDCVFKLFDKINNNKYPVLLI